MWQPPTWPPTLSPPGRAAQQEKRRRSGRQSTARQASCASGRTVSLPSDTPTLERSEPPSSVKARHAKRCPAISRHGVYCLHRQCRDQAGQQDPGEADDDGEQLGQRLSRGEVPVADRQSSNEGKVIPCPMPHPSRTPTIAPKPALKSSNPDNTGQVTPKPWINAARYAARTVLEFLLVIFSFLVPSRRPFARHWALEAASAPRATSRRSRRPRQR